ncbi:Zn-ribbon domain-containing OB-fold protein [Parapedomonas caeni]
MTGDTAHNVPAFAPDVFVEGAGGSALVGGHCRQCGSTWFPTAERCPEDGTRLEPIEIGRTGRLYSYTVVRTKAPFGLPEPYGVGYVDLDDVPLRVFMLLDPAQVDRLAIGAPVRLASATLGVGLNGEPCRRPYFTLLTDTQ